MTSRSRATLAEGGFLGICDELGYQPLPWVGGFLLASVSPDDVDRFDYPNCRRRPFKPEQVSNAERTAFEVEWRPPGEWGT
jgi:hypothetical protein